MRIKKKLLPLLLTGALLAGCAGAVFAVSAVNGTEDSSPAGLWKLPAGVTAEANVSVPDYMLYGREYDVNFAMTEYTAESKDLGLEDWQKNGVKFSATAANRWVEFANTVDITSYSKEDILFAFTPLTSARGNADFYEFNLKIEDAVNPDNYILIKAKPSQWFPCTFSAETAETGPYGDKWGTYHGSEVGTIFSDGYLVGFDGTTNETNYGPEEIKVDKLECRHRSIIFSYDYADKAIYVIGQLGRRYCIIDFDYSESVGFGKEWDGFSSGRVKLSFASKQHRSSEPSYMVLNVFNTPMNGTQTEDSVAPVISFDPVVKEDIETGLEAPAAIRGTAYTLPAYTCSDAVSGDLACNIQLTDPDGASVAVKDGVFIPAKAGYYTAVYTAEDGAGNRTERTMSILVKEGASVIRIKPGDPDQLNYSVGEEIKVPAADYICTDGAVLLSSGVKVVRVGAGSEEIATKDGCFVPLAAGEYRAVYTATDYLGNRYSASLAFYVTEPSGAVVHGTLQELRSLYDGMEVKLPALQAFDYVAKPGAGLAADVRITVSGEKGEPLVLANGAVFTPDIQTMGEAVSIKYEAKTAEGAYATVKEYTRTIQARPNTAAEGYENTGAYQMDRFLMLNDKTEVSWNEKSESAFFRVSTKEGQTGDIGFGVSIPQCADGFSVSFSVPATQKNFESFLIKLRDSEDASVGFDLEFVKITEGSSILQGSKTFIYANGERYTIDGIYNSLDANGKEIVRNFTISYMDGIISSQEGELFAVKQNFDGKAWNGFPSGKVYVDFEFRGVGNLAPAQSGEIGTAAAINLSSLCGQSFFVSYNTKGELIDFVDRTEPNIVLETELSTSFIAGQRVAVPKATAFDTLSSYVRVYITVEKADGTTVIDRAEWYEGMSFVLDGYSKYYLRYNASDAAGQSAAATYTIAASDTQAPSIALSDYADRTVKVGKKAELPAVIVQDERDTSPRLFVFVVLPDESVRNFGEVTEENPVTSFTAETAGKYRVVYYAIDSEFNAAVQTIYIVAE